MTVTARGGALTRGEGIEDIANRAACSAAARHSPGELDRRESLWHAATVHGRAVASRGQPRASRWFGYTGSIGRTTHASRGSQSNSQKLKRTDASTTVL